MLLTEFPASLHNWAVTTNGRRASSNGRLPADPITIADVARRARVSTATVSRVLTRYPHVSDHTRRRVEAALQYLRYEPNRIARSLRARATHTIGLIIRDAANTKFGLIAKAAQQVANARGYYVLVGSSDRSADRERESIDLLLQLRVDGLVLYVADERVNHLANRKRLDIPVVLVESTLPGYAFDEVCSDNVGGARAATEHLLGLGHRRIALLHGPRDIRPLRERRQGYLEAYAAAGVRPDPALIVETGTREEDAAEHTTRLMTGAAPPTAIFAASSALTIGVLQAIRAQRLRVPETLSVIGFDDTDVTALVDPPLTVVTRDLHLLGATAVETLMERLADGPRGPAKRIVLPATLHVRESCAPPASRRGTAAH